MKVHYTCGDIFPLTLCGRPCTVAFVFKKQAVTCLRCLAKLKKEGKHAAK